MAVELGDYSSGFRHSEVIRFINNEILMNGGGPEFYMAFRLRPWNEIEDQLRIILIDPEVPRSLKRACTWSALALSVRVGARQREQQAYMVGLTQDEMGQRPSAPRASVSELWQLRQQREEAVTQLRNTQIALQQAVRECDILRRRLYPAERSSQTAPLVQDVVAGAQTQHLGASVVPLNSDHARVMSAMGGYDRQYLEAQMSAATNVFYMPESTSPWPLAMQPSVPVPMPYQFPPHPPLLMGSPFLMPFPPPVVMETEGGVVVPVQMPPVYPSGSFAASYSQDPADQWDQRHMGAQRPSVSQSSVLPGNVRDASQEGDLPKPQETDTSGDIRRYIQGQRPQRTQEKATLENIGSDSEVGEKNEDKEDKDKEATAAIPAEAKAAEAAAEVAEKAEANTETQEKEEKAAAAAAYAYTVGLWKVQELHLTEEEEELHNQSEPSLQASAPASLDSTGSQIKGVEGAQPTHHVWESWSQAVRDSPKKQQPQLPKKDKPQVEPPFESQPGMNWICPKCKAMNFSWRKVCYKCRRVSMPTEGGGKSTDCRR
ncbi:AABR07041403.1 [Phodopus roborovskii]|uniref:AABR07041403.1 protein n=1 Tax=Phodopus roborovskii TaxID=109678 RepID=A0AAU9YZU1_PHORO|nr:AABR07041403.1 [Phodopus roborovskii]